MQLNRDRFVTDMKCAGLSQRALAKAVSARLEGRAFHASAVSHLAANPPRMTSVVEPVADAIAAVLGREVAWLFRPTSTSGTGVADPIAEGAEA